uniref:Uncharacterized protein n=1 Tax=Anguilla anguilla TaxID=7936 RepID=A0A0E9XC15_ANGAN
MRFLKLKRGFWGNLNPYLDLNTHRQ